MTVRTYISCALLILLASVCAFAQPPQILNYQGRLDSSGVPINGNRDLVFSIYPDSVGGTALWTETQVNVAIKSGVFNVLLGGSTPFPADLFTSSGARYLGFAVSGGNELSPRFLFTSVPYSLTAGTAQSVALAPAAGSVALSGTTLSSSPATLDQFSVVAPGPGVLMLQVSGQWWYNLDASSANSATQCFFMGLCDAANTSASCGSTWGNYCYQDADNISPTNSTMGFAITRTVPIGAAGTYTYYINGQSDGTVSLYLYSYTSATAIYIPNSLTVTSPTMPPTPSQGENK